MKKIAAVFLLAVFLSVTSVRGAAPQEEQPHGPSGEAIVFDLVLGRPLGLVTLVAGTAIFIVGLPFTLPTRSVGVAADKLIADPFRFTFIRPVGELPEDPYISPR
ncbi:MAG TPA: hypothetical protein VNK06_02605 [Thermodesulfobacteriota bacterium]|nr:hypothetical protein [Thermodesulfobacteriota bacterium]